jgi:hypothetical protein
MTELYQARSGTSETTEPAAGPEQETGEHDDLTRDESAPDGNHGQGHGHAEMQATLADEDQLPTRQDARAATWSEDPEYYDEDDPGPPHDADPGDDHALDSEQGDQDQAAADQLAPATARPDVQPAEASDNRTAPPAEETPASTSERITELEADNAELSKTVTDLQARVERLEDGTQAESSTGITGQEHDTTQRDAIQAENPHLGRRHLPTNEALALGAAAAGGVITTFADYVPFLHADVAGMATSAVAVGAAAVTWMRARREAGNANRSQD